MSNTHSPMKAVSVTCTKGCLRHQSFCHHHSLCPLPRDFESPSSVRIDMLYAGRLKFRQQSTHTCLLMRLALIQFSWVKKKLAYLSVATPQYGVGCRHPVWHSDGQTARCASLRWAMRSETAFVSRAKLRQHPVHSCRGCRW